MTTLTELWRRLSNKKYRAAFAGAQFKRLIPLQIQALRRQRNWSQARLAERSNLTQGVISRAEDQDYGNLTVNTILTIAEGFDVAFVGRFVPFSELDKWYVHLSQESMQVLSFDEENQSIVPSGGQTNARDAAQRGNIVDFGRAQEAMKGKEQHVHAVPRFAKEGVANAARGNSSC